jgi:SAM-dependent methyltransferase
MDLEEYKKANQALWNEWTGIHVRSAFYDLEGFKAGKTSLNAFEIEEIGDVEGKTLLHLQCHFGMDSLSWARLGAKVTGVDFSDQAIALARQLNEELELDAQFVCSDIYTLPDVLSGQFDIVYTSHGVLAWLPDLQRWGHVIAHFLKPGGLFYMAEGHPFASVFSDAEEVTDLRVDYPYFFGQDPLVIEVKGSYADRNAETSQKVTFEWMHTVSGILNGLIRAGLKIEFFNEYPYVTWDMIPALMERGLDGYWRLKHGEKLIPLMFTLMARK